MGSLLIWYLMDGPMNILRFSITCFEFLCYISVYVFSKECKDKKEDPKKQ